MRTIQLLAIPLTLAAIAYPTDIYANGNHHGWCHGVGNQQHSAGCASLPSFNPLPFGPTPSVNSVAENQGGYIVPPLPPIASPNLVPQAIPQPVLPPQRTPGLVPQIPAVPQQTPAIPQAIPQPVLPPQRTPGLVPQIPAVPQQTPAIPQAIPQPVLPPQRTPPNTLGAAKVPLISSLTATSQDLTKPIDPLSLIVPLPGRQQAGQLHRSIHPEIGEAEHNVCLVSGYGRRRTSDAGREAGLTLGFHLTDAIVRELPFDRHLYAGCFIVVKRRWHRDHSE